MGSDKSQQGAQHRGVTKTARGYVASCRISILWLHCRERRDLAAALDDLMVITRVRQRCKCSDHDLDVSFKAAVEDTLQESGATFEGLGLSINLDINNGFWVGQCHLRTPNERSLESLMAAFKRMSPFRGRRGVRGFCMLLQRGFDDLQLEWRDCRSTYLDICEERGWDRGKLVRKLDYFEAARAPHRERTFECWNRWAMAREDPAREQEGHQHAFRRACRILALWRQQRARRQRARAREEQQLRRAARLAAEAGARARRSRYTDLTFEEILQGVRSRSDR